MNFIFIGYLLEWDYEGVLRENKSIKNEVSDLYFRSLTPFSNKY